MTDDLRTNPSEQIVDTSFSSALSERYLAYALDNYLAVIARCARWIETSASTAAVCDAATET